MSEKNDEFVPDLLRPNKYMLDSECEAQTGLYGETADQLADAKETLARMEAREEVVKAEIELKIRKSPERFGINNVTENAIKATIRIQPEVKKARLKVIKAHHLVNMLTGRCRTLEHRKQSLEDLVYLDSRDYFSRPKVPKEATEAARIRERRRVRKSLPKRDE
jgi:hypothetical protein